METYTQVTNLKTTNDDLYITKNKYKNEISEITHLFNDATKINKIYITTNIDFLYKIKKIDIKKNTHVFMDVDGVILKNNTNEYEIINNASYIIKFLQKNGITVTAVTSRLEFINSKLYGKLKQNNITFDSFTPTTTGIIFTNGLSKGYILCKLFENF